MEFSKSSKICKQPNGSFSCLRKCTLHNETCRYQNKLYIFKKHNSVNQITDVPYNYNNTKRKKFELQLKDFIPACNKAELENKAEINLDNGESCLYFFFAVFFFFYNLLWDPSAVRAAFCGLRYKFCSSTV